MRRLCCLLKGNYVLYNFGKMDGDFNLLPLPRKIGVAVFSRVYFVSLVVSLLSVFVID